MAVFGFVTILFCVGPLLDTSTVLTASAQLSWKMALTVYSMGFVSNLKHAVACAVTMLLLSKPLLYKLDRLKNKYGMMDVREESHEQR